MSSPTITIDSRFCGPTSSGNGGYTAGVLAEALGADGPTTVTLRQPPPLDTPLQLSRTADGVLLTFGGVVVGEAAPATIELETVDPVEASSVAEAMAAYKGMQDHPFPHCFVCAPDRTDGLRLRPGQVPGAPGTTAASWRPDASLADTGQGGQDPDQQSDKQGGQDTDHDAVARHFLWSALDCPGGWTVDFHGRPMVLGRITGVIDAVPHVGDECLVMGRLIETEGRKSFTATTLYDPDGRVLGRAMATWFAIDPANFR